MEERAVLQQQRVERGKAVRAGAQADDVAHMLQVVVEAPDQADSSASASPRCISMQPIRVCERRSAAGDAGRDALAAHALLVGLPAVAVALRRSGVDELEVAPRLEAQPARAMRASMTAGRPIRVSWARPSSRTTWAARSARSSSPSA